MPWGKVRDVVVDCDSCLDEETVRAQCVECDGTGWVIISADGDQGVCGECGGDGSVIIPCPNHDWDAVTVDETEPILTDYQGRE